MQFQDENSNYISGASKPHSGYKTHIKKMKVPNYLITTMEAAAEESNLSPIPRRQVQLPRYLVNNNYRRKIPTPSPPHSPTPGILQAKSIGERRREKLLLSNDKFMSDLSSNEEVSRSPTPEAKPQVKAVPKEVSIMERLKRLQLNNDFQQKKLNATNVLNKLKVKKPIPTTIDWNGFKIPDPATTTFMRGGPRHTPFKPEPNTCCCDRPRRLVLCVMCGYMIKGNIKVTCPRHPKNNYLYQMEACPNPKCRAPRLLKEIDSN